MIEILPSANVQLPELDNPEKFVVIPNVAILDQDEDFDEAFLRQTVERTNARTKDGDYIVLTIGHTTDEDEEQNQPEPIGYSPGVKLGTLGDRLAILADLYIAKDELDNALSFPRRSVELWHDDDGGFIDIVSLLRRTPARNLGLVTAKKDGHLTRYSRHFNGALMINEEIKAELSTYAKFAEPQTATSGTTATPPPSLARFEKEEDEDKDEDEDVKDDESMDDCETMEKDEDEDEEKDVNEYAAPSGTNTFVPGTVDSKERKRMAADQARIKLNRLSKELKKVKSERDHLLLKLRRSERERDLTQLEAEGFVFDRAEELAYVETLNDKTYEGHLNRIRSRYRRSPVGQKAVPTASPEAPSLDRSKIDDVIRFARKENIADFRTAFAKYTQMGGH